MKNEVFVYLTDLISRALVGMRLDYNIRVQNDVRLVFYHGIGDGSSHCMKYLNDEISQDDFAKHLDYLAENYCIIPLAETIKQISKEDNAKDKPYCNISFDDGLYSVYSKAFPLLKERSMPFDVFLNTSVIGNKGLLWLHLLNYAISTKGFNKVIELIIECCEIESFPQFKDVPSLEGWLRENFEYVYNTDLLFKISRKLGLDPKKIAKEQNIYLDFDQIEEMSSMGAGFYSHTHSHFPLGVFSDDAIIKNEIDYAFNDMRKLNCGTSNFFVSFPFGMKKDYGEKAAKIALSSGHKYVVEVGNGLNLSSSILNDKIISRVSLGSVSTKKSSLYSAIEIRPVLKSRIKKIFS